MEALSLCHGKIPSQVFNTCQEVQTPPNYSFPHKGMPACCLLSTQTNENLPLVHNLAWKHTWPHCYRLQEQQTLRQLSLQRIKRQFAESVERHHPRTGIGHPPTHMLVNMKTLENKKGKIKEPSTARSNAPLLLTFKMREHGAASFQQGGET